MRHFRNYALLSVLLIFIAELLPPYQPLSAHTANKVWYEFHSNMIRVCVSYTIPELKELREAYIEFTDRQKAANFYWDLVRGADFYLYSPDRIRFTEPAGRPDPW